MSPYAKIARIVYRITTDFVVSDAEEKLRSRPKRAKVVREENGLWIKRGALLTTINR